MARVKLLLLIGIGTLLGGAPLAAQHIPSPYRFLDTRQAVTVYGGHVITQAGAVGVGPMSGSIFGASVAYRASSGGPFELELSLSYLPLKRSVRDTTLTADSTYSLVGTATQNIILAAAALRFDLTGPRTWHYLQPYLLLGGGGAFGASGSNGADRLVPQEARFNFGTSFAAQVGGGIEWYVTSRLGLRVEGRGTLWKLHTPSGFLVHDLTLPASEWAQNASVTAGLSVHF